MLLAGVQPTSEQSAVITVCSADANVVIEAGAGTGKTTVLRMVAENFPERRGVYVAYNRATADAARRVFPSSVACVTAHGLAYRAVGYRYADRLPGRSPRMPSWAVARTLGITSGLPLGASLMLTQAHLARIVVGTVERFCHSADRAVSAAHIPFVRGLDADALAELSWHIVPLARQAWTDLQRPDGRLPVSHDHYLKMWQLSGPKIGADYLMFDEAQDANPVVASVVQEQSGAQKIVVGDSCQAIYGWRGAIDALDDWPCDVRLSLTQSWRFGDPVADEANKWLTKLDAGYRLTGAPFITSAVGTVPDPQVIVCRTNAEAFIQARQQTEAGRRVALGGGVTELKALAQAALDLAATGETSHPDLAAFRSWSAVQDYVRRDAAGADLSAAVRLIERYGAAAVLGTLDALTRVERADVVACTAHAAKGREWDRVLIAGDFPDLADRAIPRPEAMLAYVAVTRARSQLDPSGLAWIDHHSSDTARTQAPGRKENTMDIGTEISSGSLDNAHRGDETAPYAGGRVQAESGCRVIAADYAAWTTVSPPDAGGTALTQFVVAWYSAGKRGLDDGPGPVGIRYRVLSHAANVLAESPSASEAEQPVLRRLAAHARIHGDRLRATGQALFERSGQSGPYTGGRRQADSGSQIVAADYRSWSQAPGASALLGSDTEDAAARRLLEAWRSVQQYRLDDGPRPAAARYSELADAANAVANQQLSAALPPATLGKLLDLADHARKHATRLRATADALTTRTQEPAERVAISVAAEFEHPVSIEERTRQARSAQPGPDDRDQDPGMRESRRKARVRHYNRNRDDRSR
jgi:hypothetical protein